MLYFDKGVVWKKEEINVREKLKDEDIPTRIVWTLTDVEKEPIWKVIYGNNVQLRIKANVSWIAPPMK